jgi:hypothetical protein
LLDFPSTGGREGHFTLLRSSPGCDQGGTIVKKLVGVPLFLFLVCAFHVQASALTLNQFFVSLTSGNVTDARTFNFTPDSNGLVDLSSQLAGVTLVAGSSTLGGLAFSGDTDPFFTFSASGQVAGQAVVQYGFISEIDLCSDYFIAGDSLGITLSPAPGSPLSITPINPFIQTVSFLGGGGLNVPGSLDIGTAVSFGPVSPPNTQAFSWASGYQPGTGPINGVVLLGDYTISGMGSYGLSGNLEILCVIPEPGSVTTVLVGLACVGGGFLYRRRKLAR